MLINRQSNIETNAKFYCILGSMNSKLAVNDDLKSNLEIFEKNTSGWAMYLQYNTIIFTIFQKLLRLSSGNRHLCYLKPKIKAFETLKGLMEETRANSMHISFEIMIITAYNKRLETTNEEFG